MDMQDRELDDIFRSKLEGFEAEPTEKVWSGIDTGLDNDKRRRAFVPLMGVAASVIILLTTGVLFILHKEEIKPVKHEQIKLVQNPAPAVKRQEAIIPTKQPEQVKTVEHKAVIETIAHAVVHKKTEISDVTNPAPIIKETPEVVPPVVPQQEVIAAVRTPAEVKPPVETNENTQPVAKLPEPINLTPAQTKPQSIAQVPIQQPAAKPTKRHGIHNMGDLVNLVVAKVDKRKEKLIQFSDTDDDESNLTALNIGPIKLNREDKGER